MKNIRVLLMSLAFTFLFLFLLELSGRWYFYQKHHFGYKESFLYEGDEALGYKISAQYKGKHGLCYRGMRKGHFDINKGNKVRIVCLGESTTFGQEQFDNAKVWPQILEGLLNNGSQPPDYEVLNAGVCGYGSSNLAARLRKDILALEPDAVIIFTGWNLVGCLKSKYSWVPGNVYFKGLPISARVNNFLVDNSIVYLKLKNAIGGLFNNRQNASGAGKFDEVYKDLLPVFAGDLREMIMICRQNNIMPIVVKYPARDYDSQRYRDTIDIIEGVCGENNARLLDCSSFFESLDYESRCKYFSDIAHFSDQGNEKMAQIIYSGLEGIL